MSKSTPLSILGITVLLHQLLLLEDQTNAHAGRAGNG
jgi:hypothetical protein